MNRANGGAASGVLKQLRLPACLIPAGFVLRSYHSIRGNEKLENAAALLKHGSSDQIETALMIFPGSRRKRSRFRRCEITAPGLPTAPYCNSFVTGPRCAAKIPLCASTEISLHDHSTQRDRPDNAVRTCLFGSMQCSADRAAVQSPGSIGQHPVRRRLPDSKTRPARRLRRADSPTSIIPRTLNPRPGNSNRYGSKRRARTKLLLPRHRSTPIRRRRARATNAAHESEALRIERALPTRCALFQLERPPLGCRRTPVSTQSAPVEERLAKHCPWP